MLYKIGKHDTDLSAHNIVLSNYEGKTGYSLGAIQVDVAVGSIVRPTLFLVIQSKANFNLLLGREWIHGVGAVPSTLHQKLIIWREDGISFHQLGGIYMKINMTEATAWARITAYMAENRLNTAFEAEFQQNMADEAKIEDHENKETKDRRLDCIYDDEPLGFEKNPISEVPKMQAQDPLEEVDIGDGSIKRPTYISANITSSLKEKLVPLLREFKDCFAWDYHEMPGLSREMVEMKLPIKEGKRPVKQLPRRFAPEIMSKIKEEIERLLRCKFIRAARDLNNATPKDEYAMPVAEMLVDSAAGFEFL
ncbi:hypothetical protein glysoja_015321, partial [Glycine soja]